MASEDIVEYDDIVSEDSSVSTSSDTKSKPGHVGVHSSTFRDLGLKPELLKAITDNRFEHPSDVQHECIPVAAFGTDIICQAKAGVGKTAVFVLSSLQQLNPADKHLDTLVLCHTRELAFQICQEFMRFSKYLPEVHTVAIYGGIPIEKHIELITRVSPQIIVGTPGRVVDLIEKQAIKLDTLKRFVMDECDQLIDDIKMRKTVQDIFLRTPRDRQVMMFSATMNANVREVAKKFTNNPVEVLVHEEKQLTLYGLQQYSCELTEAQKNRKLTDILDSMDFNQVIIFVSSVSRCRALAKLLQENSFPAIEMHSRLDQKVRLEAYEKFKRMEARIMVSTDLFGRGVDFERINIVINYDMPTVDDQYLHRVGRSGRFGTKGLAISFIASDEDRAILAKIQSRFEVGINVLPDLKSIEKSSYMNA